MTRHIPTLLVTLSLLSTTLPAQEAVAPGTYVRLKVIESDKLKVMRGTIVNQVGDSLYLTFTDVPDPAATPYAVPLAAVRQIAVFRGRGPKPLEGAWKGAVTGLALGFGTLSYLCGEQDVQLGPGDGAKDNCTLSDFGAILLFSAVLGVAGGAVGLVVGTIVGGETWHTVPPKHWRPTLRPGSGGGVGVGLSFAF
jgi:hypothetical protein